MPFLLWVESAPTNCPAALTLTIGGVWPLVGVSQNGATVSMGVHASTAAAVSGADQLFAVVWRPEPAAPAPTTWTVTGEDEALTAHWQQALAAGKSVDLLPGRQPGKGVWPLIHAAPGAWRMVGFSPRADGFAAAIHA